MSFGTRMRRSIGAVSRRALSSERPGRKPVRIDDLISPLRYDVLVRQRFLKQLAEAGPKRRRDVDGLAERARGGPYFAWFREIVVRRFRPELIGDEEAILRAFSERVARSVSLLESFEASGYDAGQAIVLRTGRTILPTASGKRLDRRLYAGDGCHRLALLRLAGSATLEPGSYRVHSARRFAPLDHTATLIPLLGLEPGRYFEFLSLTYAPGRGLRTERELLDHVRSHGPECLPELERLLAVDLPLLGAHGSGASPSR